MHCEESLNWSLSTKWPETLPALHWQGLRIAGAPDKMAFEACHEEADSPTLAALLFDVFPELSLYNLSELRSELLRLGLFEATWPELIEKYHFHNPIRLEKLLDLLSQTSKAFCKWTEEKKLGPRDLGILWAIPDILPHQWIFDKIAKDNPSKSIGVQCIEYAVELSLMGVNPEEMQSHTPSHQWVNQLKKLRYPMSTEKDLDQSEKASLLPWPKESRVSWERKGDRTGIQLQLQFKNQEELSNTIRHLTRVHNLLEKNPDKLWN